LFQKQFGLVGRQVVVEGEVRMADSVVFDFVCELIEGLTALDVSNRGAPSELHSKPRCSKRER